MQFKVPFGQFAKRQCSVVCTIINDGIQKDIKTSPRHVETGQINKMQKASVPSLGVRYVFVLIDAGLS
jgi:hypothetical protein